MDSYEASLDRIEAQRSTDGAMPPVPEFLNNLILSDLYNLPGESVTMSSEIYSAMRAGDESFMEELRNYKTPMACFKNGDTGDSILHLAAAFGHLELVKSIISECPCLLLELNWKDRLPLHVAAHAGHLAVVEALVASVKYFQVRLSEEDKERLNVYVFKDINGDTPLHLALKQLHEKQEHRVRNRRSMLDFIMKRSIKCSDASTPLMGTACFLVNANRCVSFLTNYDGISPLYLAVEGGNVSLVYNMLKTGDNYVQGRISSELQGRRSLVHAALKAKNTDVLDVILKEDPSLLDEVDEKGRTCLSVGVSVGFYKGVCYLLDKSVKAIYVRDEDGYFPIHIAAKYGDVEILKTILERCPNALVLVSSFGQNIFHVAAKNGRVKTIRFILRLYKGGKIEYLLNEQDAEGNTPLHLATIYSHPKVVRILTWDDRIDMKTSNNNDQTPRDIARMNLHRGHTQFEVLTWVPLASASGPRGFKVTLPGQSGLSAGKDEVNIFLVVSTLVATMTFTAGFALPGGYNGNSGMAALAKKTAFQVFLVFDTLAMYCSLLMTVTLLWAKVSHPSLAIKAFRLSFPLLGLSLTSMLIAFMAGTYASVSHLPMLAYSILGMGLIFLVVFLLLIIPYVCPKGSNKPFFRHISYFPYILMLYAAGDNRRNICRKSPT